MVVVEAEGPQETEGEVQDAPDLVLHLVGTTEDVGVVLGETAHPEHAVEDAAPLVAIDGAQFPDAHGQVPIATGGRLVVHDVEGAVHRFQVVLLPLHLHGRVHVLAVEVQVAAGLPQVGPPHVRGVDQLIAGPDVLLSPEVLDDAADAGALGMPDDKAGAHLLVDGEEVQLSAQGAVVSAAGLL